VRQVRRRLWNGNGVRSADCLERSYSQETGVKIKPKLRLYRYRLPYSLSSQQLVQVRPRLQQGTGLFKVGVLMRAGLNDRTIAALRELRALCPGLNDYTVSGIYRDAAAHDLSWDVAQAAIEIFDNRITTSPSDLLRHWLDSGRSVEEIDRWFSARPSGIDGFWVKERLRFAQSHGRGQALLEQLADGVRRDPANLTNALIFLEAMLYAPEATKPDLSWFQGLVKPVRAVDAMALADRLRQLQNCTAALTYYEKAITIPLTEAELQELGMMRAIIVSSEKLRASFTVQAGEAMAECLLKLRRSDAAQQRMIEAADLREQHGLGRHALLAGQVQAASGHRAMEGRIVEAEKTSENNPAYWRERAQYFRGRKETEREEQALRKGFSLTQPEPRPERSRRHTDLRSWLLSDLARFLVREGRGAEAVALLRQEIAATPATAESSERAASLLVSDFREHVRAADPILWEWLANRTEWNHHEERLLWRMMENEAERGELFSRGENLAFHGHPTRAYALGWVMNRLGDVQQSIPLLKAATARADDNQLKQRAALALLESLLDSGNWRAAEEIFPLASGQLTGVEIPEWHSRLALTAARQGAGADALRLWIRTANVSPTTLAPVPELARLGLRDELVAFYRTMEKEFPASHVPAQALKLLESEGEPKNRARKT
jgi:tetratricopeptide (TPR) repeat protein